MAKDAKITGGMGLTSSPIETATHNDDFWTLAPNATFHGLTYSNLMAMWWNWALGESPDYRNDRRLIFLRGRFTNSYKYSIPKAEENNLSMAYDPDFINNRTGFRKITITDKTSIFHPVTNVHFAIGDRYEGSQLTSVNECRLAARKEFEKGGAIWANYAILEENDEETAPKSTNDGIKAKPIVERLTDYYAESEPFILTIPEGGSTLPQDPQYELHTGDYPGVDVGIYILIPKLSPNLYRFDFGIITSSYYVSRACYDIMVIEDKKKDHADVSKAMPIFPEQLPS